MPSKNRLKTIKKKGVKMITIIINKFLEFLGIKRVNSGTLILKALLEKPLSNTEIRQIAFNNRTNKSGYHQDFKNPVNKHAGNYKKDSTIKKVPNGWFCCGVNDLVSKGVIKYNNSIKKYEITEIGRLNINKPYTKKPILSHKLYTNKIESLQDKLMDGFHKHSYNSLGGWYLYKLLDSINGELVEKGWENFDTYSDNFFEDYTQTMELLKKLNKHYGDKLENEALEYGLIEKIQS